MDPEYMLVLYSLTNYIYMVNVHSTNVLCVDGVCRLVCVQYERGQCASSFCTRYAHGLQQLAAYPALAARYLV